MGIPKLNPLLKESNQTDANREKRHDGSGSWRQEFSEEGVDVLSVFFWGEIVVNSLHRRNSGVGSDRSLLQIIGHVINNGLEFSNLLRVLQDVIHNSLRRRSSYETESYLVVDSVFEGGTNTVQSHL